MCYCIFLVLGEFDLMHRMGLDFEARKIFLLSSLMHIMVFLPCKIFS
jgi:hypothetical protein